MMEEKEFHQEKSKETIDAEREFEEREECGEVVEECKREKKMILTSSWGISLVVHGLLILIFMAIYFVQPQSEEPPTVIARPEIQEKPFDETKPTMLKKTPKIKKAKAIKCGAEVEHKRESRTPKPTPVLSETNREEITETNPDYVFGPSGTPHSGGAYPGRMSHKTRLGSGATPGTENALLAALKWLKRHQSPEGFWISADYDRFCSRQPKCKNQHAVPARHRNSDYGVLGRGTEYYDAGVSGLALLAFLGHGSTHRAGRFKKTVRKGLEWLKKIQVNDPYSKWHGSIGYMYKGQRVDHSEWLYCHAIATMVLCEAYAMTKDFTLKPFAQRAVNFIVKCQNPDLGWRYGNTPEQAIQPGRNDTSVTGWMVLALKAAKASGPPEDGGLEVPQSAFKGAIKWLDKVTSYGGKAGYMTPGGGSSVLRGNQGLYNSVPTNTAVAALCRVFAGQSPRHTLVQKGTQIVYETRPEWNPKKPRTVNFYYWYYATYAMFQVGGRKWDCGKKPLSRKKLKNLKCSCWNHSMQKALIFTQRMEGKACVHGSWDPVGEWGSVGGRVYSTALGALILEIYYRYERLNN